jgi:hypothetical protein
VVLFGGEIQINPVLSTTQGSTLREAGTETGVETQEISLVNLVFGQVLSCEFTMSPAGAMHAPAVRH